MLFFFIVPDIVYQDKPYSLCYHNSIRKRVML